MTTWTDSASIAPQAIKSTSKGMFGLTVEPSRQIDGVAMVAQIARILIYWAMRSLTPSATPALPGHTMQKAPHRCEALFIWLPDLDSNQGPAD